MLHTAGWYRRAIDPTARFAQLVTYPEEEIALDEGALLIAAHADPDLDVREQLARLDELAARCPAPTLEGLARHLFVDEGFAGDGVDYYSPENSYLDRVLDRRCGIPITLSVLAIEVGRRIGVPLVGVGMPGHFLVRSALDDDTFLDPFAGGARLDRAACERRHRDAVGGLFSPSMLDPVGPRAILARMLGNLKEVHRRRGDRRSLAWVLRLRVAIPGVPPSERQELATTLAADGRFLEAADELDELAAAAPTQADDARRGAQLLRARLN